MKTNGGMTKRWGKTLLALTLVLAFGAAAETSAQTLPTLVGEYFFAQPQVVENTDIIFQRQCGTSIFGPGTMSFIATGVATGPYPGTFTETGTVTVDNGQVTDLQTTFTIYSPTGKKIVSGSKTLVESIYGRCSMYPGGFGQASINAFVRYEADLGGFTDSGEGYISTSTFFSDGGETTGAFFQEEFLLSYGLVQTATLGKVTGGGQILHAPDALGAGGVTFGFVAMNTDGGMKGSGVVVDHDTGTTIRILDVTSLMVVGTHATFSGRAEVNGVEQDYQIDVDDLGEPGALALNPDTFKIVTGSYMRVGPLTGGNIQIHKKPEPTP